MRRVLIALCLTIGLFAVPAPPASAHAPDQAGWAERKRHVVPPNGVRMAVLAAFPRRPAR